MYRPALVEVHASILLEIYLERNVPILDQRGDGPCTGFALATVINFLLYARDEGQSEPVSPWMLYQMAQRYDEWVGTAYVGTSARGAMKGWSKHGVCSHALWSELEEGAEYTIGPSRACDAAMRPLGAYYRVEHTTVSDMHCALEEVGIIYATTWTHSGWQAVGPDGRIPFHRNREQLHAVAIVAYDEEGFWIQNSWGDQWGRGGLAHITYGDWLVNGTDAWIARLGVPMRATGRRGTPSGTSQASDSQLASHVVSVLPDGGFLPWGRWGMTSLGLQSIFEDVIPQVTATWSRKRILVEIPGGVGRRKEWVQQLESRRQGALDQEIFPLLVAWGTELGRFLPGIVEGALADRSPGELDPGEQPLSGRIDETIEVLVRRKAKTIWDSVREGAIRTARMEAGVIHQLARLLASFVGNHDDAELHILGHGSGALLAVQLVQLLTTRGIIASGPLEGLMGQGRRVHGLTLWSPACTIQSFKRACLPALRAGDVWTMQLYTLLDPIERNVSDFEGYSRSLLYLISNALEEKPRLPPHDHGVPLLGLSSCVGEDAELQALWADSRLTWIRCPVGDPDDSERRSNASTHDAFLEDVATRESLYRDVHESSALAHSKFQLELLPSREHGEIPPAANTARH